MILWLNYLKKIIFILGDEKKKLPSYLIFFIFLSLVELLGLALLGPYISFNKRLSHFEKNTIVSIHL